jgi:Na+/phosphate symporter
MLIAIIPLLILVVGLLMYALAANPKVQEAGRIMFFCGMLVITFVLAKQTLSLG